MCGIVGIVSNSGAKSLILDGLKRLEYRGYDSAGIAVADANSVLSCLRRIGNVDKLIDAAGTLPDGSIGIGHTRWATHGGVTEANAHPHTSSDSLLVVHNGIIENFRELRRDLELAGYKFKSETDTEVLVHAIHREFSENADLFAAVRNVVSGCSGSYAFVVMNRADPTRLVAVRSGCPLVIGIGNGANYVASDHYALLSVTNRFQYLEEGDIAEIARDAVNICDRNGMKVERRLVVSTQSSAPSEKGAYRHFMLKEIHEQPVAIRRTLEGKLDDIQAKSDIFGPNAADLFRRTSSIQMIASGTSYNACAIASYWIESLLGISCKTDVGSEYRHRGTVLPQDGCLLICVSQSGETLDTLAALRVAKTRPYIGFLAICNVSGSTLVRESDSCFITEAGFEMGVASTKAFTTQLVSFLLLCVEFARAKELPAAISTRILRALRILPLRVEETLDLERACARMASHFVESKSCIYVGRGTMYPVAMEGALKLKEISYIHAEGFAAGELKHGALALVDAHMPVVVVAPKDALAEKLKANISEIRARGGIVFAFVDTGVDWAFDAGVHLIRVPRVDEMIAPIIYVIPLQLLAYHVALLKGTDIDQPRNLAKSVTVE